MRIRPFDLLFLGFFLALSVRAQQTQWSQPLTATGEATGHAIATDRLGNVYTTGTFEGTARFDTLLRKATGSADIFVQKQKVNGIVEWVKQIGGSGYDEGLSIAVDALDNVYITGSFEGKILFGNIQLVAVGETDIFVLKLNSYGKMRWVKQIGGPGEDVGSGITVDANRSVYLTGSFTDTLDLDPGTGTARLTSPRQAGFVLKLDALGDFVWGKPFGSGQALSIDFKDRIATLANDPGTVAQWGQPSTDIMQTPPASTPSPTRPGTSPAPTKPAATKPGPAKPTSSPTTASTPAPAKPTTAPAPTPVPSTVPASSPGTTPPLLVAPKPNQEQQARALAVVELAKTYIGTPYRFAGISHEGIDCSGLCMVAYESIGVTLPHKSTVISDIISPKIAPFTELLPGDIVCFAQPVPEAKVSHVGLVSRIEGDKVYFIHASSSEGVQENELTQNQYWAPRYRHSVRPVLGGALASRLARLAPFEIGD